MSVSTNYNKSKFIRDVRSVVRTKQPIDTVKVNFDDYQITLCLECAERYDNKDVLIKMLVFDNDPNDEPKFVKEIKYVYRSGVEKLCQTIINGVADFLRSKKEECEDEKVSTEIHNSEKEMEISEFNELSDKISLLSQSVDQLLELVKLHNEELLKQKDKINSLIEKSKGYTLI